MATSYTTKLGLQKPATGDRSWDAPLLADLNALDALAPVSGLFVAPAEFPSTTLNVKVAAGNYRATDGTVAAYAGSSGFAITLSSTLKLWLNSTGTLTSGASFPSTAHVRLATVVSDTTTISSITDERVTCGEMGTGMGFVLRAGDTMTGALVVSTGGITISAGGLTVTTGGSTINGGNVTWADAVDVVLGTATGTKIGTSASQKIGLYGVTPVIQATSTTDLRTALINVGLVASGGASPLNLNGGALTAATLAVGTTTLSDAANIVVGTGTGTKIGTATGQKIGLYNATPVIQATSTADLRTALINIGIVATGGASPLNLNGGLLTAGSATIAAAGTVTLGAATNLVLDTATGTKFGTGTSQKIGLWNATPIVRPSGYTQTYSTADKTISAYTADNQSSAYTGIDDAQPGSVYAQLADLNALRAAYETLRAFAEDVAQALNAVIDDDQLLGLRG